MEGDLNPVRVAGFPPNRGHIDHAIGRQSAFNLGVHNLVSSFGLFSILSKVFIAPILRFRRSGRVGVWGGLAAPAPYPHPNCQAARNLGLYCNTWNGWLRSSLSRRAFRSRTSIVR